MGMHDWSKVMAGTYHNLHFMWLATLTNRINAGLLPPGYFAMAEQRISGPEPDILTLAALDHDSASNSGGTASLTRPRASVVEAAERVHYARKTRRVAIHHGLGNIVAVLKLLSPGNKSTKPNLRSFTRKSAALIRNGIHLVVVDPFRPGRHDPRGIHRAIWEQISDTDYEQPADRPWTVASYHATPLPTAYVEPFAPGQALPEAALFLDDQYHVPVPLEQTYQETWAVMPREIRRLLEPAA